MRASRTLLRCLPRLQGLCIPRSCPAAIRSITSKGTQSPGQGRSGKQVGYIGISCRRRSSSISAKGALHGKLAVVTGASSGIGLATAKALAQEGMIVVMVSRSISKLEKVKEQVPGCVLHSCDIADSRAVHSLTGALIERFGRIDILANCAGVMYFTLMKNLFYDQWKQMIDTNCIGTVNMCGAVLPFMLAAQAGHIVNVSSDAAKQVFPALAVYNASKAFVNTFSKSIRAECVGTGIRVTDIQPGDTATNLVMGNADVEAAGKVGVEIGEIIGKGFDRGSILDAEDVASAIVYALTVPVHVGLHEILIEPRDQMFGDPTAMGVTPIGMYSPHMINSADEEGE